MEPILAEFAKGGLIALAFGILLFFVLRMFTEERARAYEQLKESAKERTGNAEERMKSIATLEKMAGALEKISHTQEMQQHSLAAIADDVKDLKRWRDGHQEPRRGEPL